MVATRDLKSLGHNVRAGSSPAFGTNYRSLKYCKIKKKETIMETFMYVLIGILSAVFTYSIGYSVIGVVKGNKKQKELEDRIFQIELDLGNLHRELTERIDLAEMRVDGDIKDLERDFNSQLDSRLDKLQTKLKGLIPPTNNELMNRIEKIEEESYRLRMNM